MGWVIFPLRKAKAVPQMSLGEKTWLAGHIPSEHLIPSSGLPKKPEMQKPEKLFGLVTN